jgi:hypothetical protein
MIQYIEYVNTIAVATKFHVSTLKGSMALLSSTITAQAQQTNQSWPFVTVPAYEVLGQGVRTQAGVESIIMAPYVTQGDYDRWGSYSTQQFQNWFQQSRDTMIVTGNNSLVSTDYVSGPNRPYIFDYPRTVQEMAVQGISTNFVPSNEQNDGPYLPFWYVHFDEKHCFCFRFILSPLRVPCLPFP